MEGKATTIRLHPKDWERVERIKKSMKLKTLTSVIRLALKMAANSLDV